MERERLVLLDLVKDAYPELDTLVSLDRWMAHDFVAPIVFVSAQGVMEREHSPVCYQVMADAGIALQYPQVDGVYQPISTEPLRQLLRSCGYSYRSRTGDTFIEIDSSTLRIWTDRRDRTDITFRFSYYADVAKAAVPKINQFDIQTSFESQDQTQTQLFQESDGVDE